MATLSASLKWYFGRMQNTITPLKSGSFQNFKNYLWWFSKCYSLNGKLGNSTGRKLLDKLIILLVSLYLT